MNSEDKKYRVFLSYRGDSTKNTEGKEFSEALYKFLKDDPESLEKYGDVYYSPITDPTGNFWNDIPIVMKSAEYFIMPLTKEYFEGFWNDTENCLNEQSVPYREISHAIKRKCKFICLQFSGFEDDNDLYRKIFKNNEKIISAAKRIAYNIEDKEETIKLISEELIRPEFSALGAHDLLKNLEPNIFLDFKEKMEDDFPFYQRLRDVKKLTFVNFASSSILAGMEFASLYENCDSLEKWFRQQLARGEIEADIIINDPYCAAAKDAIEYKMYPGEMKDGKTKENIIPCNLQKLFKSMKACPASKLRVYLTKIALPYGMFITEHKNQENNHMKIDLYSAVISHDKRRPSFYLIKSNDKTRRLYDFFEENARNIMENSYRFNGQVDISWLLKEPIIHRGVINAGILPHTKRAYEACINAQHPIEVDLLKLADGTIIVGRDDQDISKYSEETGNKTLAECTMLDLMSINDVAGEDKILTLNEFLDLVCGKIPVLMEIKISNHNDYEEIRNYVKEIVPKVQNYIKTYGNKFSVAYDTNGYGIALHSANPYAMKFVKEFDCMVPCGIISTDFGAKKEAVGEAFVDLHTKAEYMNVFEPDFVSYDVRFLKNGIAKTICVEKNIPLLVWTVTDRESQRSAYSNRCNNIIIEGSKNYM